MNGIEGLDATERLSSVFSLLQGVLAEMGIDEVGPDSLVAAPNFPDASALIQDADRLNRFIGRFALAARFVGYTQNDLAFLTVEQVCEMYLRDSYPEIPKAPLSDDQYVLAEDALPDRTDEAESEFPICFVLGCGRSGTTLLRTMLNLHGELWAPGELHLAHYDGMAARAANIPPALRYLPIPEAASRCGQPIASFATVFRRWELDNVSVSEVYRCLHDADPGVLIVDKTPPYSGRLRTLKRIGRLFPNARFVHIVRSPHDVIRSLVRMQLYKGVRVPGGPELNPYHVAEIDWFRHNSNIEAFLLDLPEERKCTVRYEELVADAEQPLRRICGLVGRAYEPAMEDPYEQRRGRVALGAGDPQINFLDRVENRTPSEPFYPIGSGCRRLAERYGY